MERFLWVCLAGALGTGARYFINLWAGERLGLWFPYGTLIVNVAGCFLIALVMEAALLSTAFPPTFRLALATGFMGGLTTYSSFAYETTRMAQAGTPGTAAINFLLTTVAGFVAILLGLGAARLIFGRG